MKKKLLTATITFCMIFTMFLAGLLAQESVTTDAETDSDVLVNRAVEVTFIPVDDLEEPGNAETITGDELKMILTMEGNPAANQIAGDTLYTVGSNFKTFSAPPSSNTLYKAEYKFGEYLRAIEKSTGKQKWYATLDGTASYGFNTGNVTNANCFSAAVGNYDASNKLVNYTYTLTNLDKSKRLVYIGTMSKNFGVGCGSQTGINHIWMISSINANSNGQDKTLYVTLANSKTSTTRNYTFIHNGSTFKYQYSATFDVIAIIEQKDSTTSNIYVYKCNGLTSVKNVLNFKNLSNLTTTSDGHYAVRKDGSTYKICNKQS